MALRFSLKIDSIYYVCYENISYLTSPRANLNFSNTWGCKRAFGVRKAEKEHRCFRDLCSTEQNMRQKRIFSSTFLSTVVFSFLFVSGWYQPAPTSKQWHCQADVLGLSVPVLCSLCWLGIRSPRHTWNWNFLKRFFGVQKTVVLDTLPLKPVGSGGGNHKGDGKGHRGGPLQFSTGNFATTGFTSVSYIDSYLAAAGLSHSR